MRLDWLAEVKRVEGGGERFGLRSVKVSMCLDIHQIERGLLGVFDLSSDENGTSADAPHGFACTELLERLHHTVFLNESEHRRALSTWDDQAIYAREVLRGLDSQGLYSQGREQFLVWFDAPLVSQDAYCARGSYHPLGASKDS